jgi:hypothetical protein
MIRKEIFVMQKIEFYKPQEVNQTFSIFNERGVGATPGHSMDYCAILPKILLFIFLLVLSLGLPAQTKKDEESVPAKKKSDLYLRAPDAVPGTLPEMREEAYWIGKMQSPDQVVLNLDEIQIRNRNYEKYIEDRSLFDSALTQQIDKQLKDRPGLLLQTPDVKSLTTKELSALVASVIKSETDYLRSREFGNIMSIQYSTKELDAIETEISFIPERAQKASRAAITVAQCRLKIIPTIKPEHIGLFTNGKARWDLWNLDVLPVGTPVDVLYTSQTSAYYFVVSPRGYGWVAAEKIAYGLEQDISSFAAGTDFIVCAGDKVPYYADSSGTIFLGWMQMGDRLPLTKDGKKAVQLPTRNKSGELTMETAWLRSDADVHMGYLPYTRRQVLQQTFKLLDNLYDWTGAWYGRNHVTVLRDIFRSFGFNLPANGTLLSAYGHRSRMVYADEGREAQLKAIFSSEPLLTLQICENSHSQMYLGNYLGMPIVCDAHGYGYKDAEGNDLELKRWVVGTLEMPDYFLKQDITFVDLY